MRRVLVWIAVVAFFCALVLFLLFVTPFEYRVGAWRRLPALDHRLLPHVSAVFAAAFGAFFGSLSAFYLGRLQQHADRKAKRHSALIAAQYALMSQWNVLEGIRVRQLEELRTDPCRFAKLKLYRFKATPMLVPFQEMTFVLETSNPNLLQDVHLAEQSYHSCVDALQLRYEELLKFYTNPRISHHVTDFETGAGVVSVEPKDVLFLRQATDAVYETIDRTLPRLAGVVESLERLVKAMFPGKQALKMVPDSVKNSHG